MRSTRQLPNQNIEPARLKNMSSRMKLTYECTKVVRQNHKGRAVEMNATTAIIAGTCLR
jgi:hypothetical protein